MNTQINNEVVRHCSGNRLRASKSFQNALHHYSEIPFRINKNSFMDFSHILHDYGVLENPNKLSFITLTFLKSLRNIHFKLMLETNRDPS